MTDRLNGVWVAFDRDIRDDDAEGIIQAIKHLRGVVAVEGNVTDGNEWLVRERLRHEFRELLWAALNPKDKTSSP